MRLVVTADDLGIAPGVTRGIVEAHSGQISVRNTGPGCQFLIKLPLARPAPSAVSRPAPTSGVSPAKPEIARTEVGGAGGERVILQPCDRIHDLEGRTRRIRPHQRPIERGIVARERGLRRQSLRVELLLGEDGIAADDETPNRNNSEPPGLVFDTIPDKSNSSSLYCN